MGKVVKPCNFFRFRHVQVNNESAIEFYKKFGFEIVETKLHYYKRIEPADAHVLEKNLKKHTTNGQIAAPETVENNCLAAVEMNGIEISNNTSLQHTNQLQQQGKSKA